MKIAKLPSNEPEIYLAIQGEGKTIGTPLVFVRCSLCNLHCKWCDTFYTWNWESTPWKHDFAPKVQISKEQKEMSVQQVADYIKKTWAPNHGVVFTGGEPTLHQDEIIEVIKLLGQGYYEIETNGTIPLKHELLTRLSQINCSPKLSGSGNEKDKRYKPEVLKQIRDHEGIFKFVISNDNDIKEVEEIQKDLKIPNNQIYIMPQGIRMVDIIVGSRYLNEVAMKKGWNISTRLQVILYGEKRAV